jgi:glutamate-5-semialdehyde dehydrogenase
MTSAQRLRAGDFVAVGRKIIEIEQEFADSLQDGDEVIAVASLGSLRRVSGTVKRLVDESMANAVTAFSQMASVSEDAISEFFDIAARLLADDLEFTPIAEANAIDMLRAREKGKSTTRLELTTSMRDDMVAAFVMWRDVTSKRTQLLSSVQHEGWTVEEWTAPLGVVGFVFEGRPNVFADATGVLRSGNTVVFRIGSDALGTASELMNRVIRPALQRSGLPINAVTLLHSAEHSAGWALFSDSRLSLAVARGSGEAVAELGSIAQQAGIPVSLHGTGGAWLIVGTSPNLSFLESVVAHSLDRKVCNTLNVVTVLRTNASVVMPIVMKAAINAAAKRGTTPVIHAIGESVEYLEKGSYVEGEVVSLATEYEWENSPEFSVVIVDSVEEAVNLFNSYSPQFIVSLISSDSTEEDFVWANANAPFVGNGITRWVDGQFALLRPELGLSNWQSGRLFGRSAILSGDSSYSVRLKMHQDMQDLHR